MKIALSISVCVVSLAVSTLKGDMTFSPASDSTLLFTTNSLGTSFERYYSRHSNEVDSVGFVRSPVVMCAYRHDVLSVLMSNVCSSCDSKILNGGLIDFDRNLGPFSSATVALFNPPNPYLNPPMNFYGQIEAIVSTSLVECVSFNVAINELEKVKQMFEGELGNLSFEKSTSHDEVRFTTRSSTSFGWHVALSAKRVAVGVLLQMNIFRKRHAAQVKDTVLPIEIDI